MNNRIKSFKFAIMGIIYCIKTQRNMQIHTLAAFLVLSIAYMAGINSTDLIALCITITLVLLAEMINTAVETTVDLYTKDYHPLAKIAKDVAAGGVLLTAVNAIIVGFVIFYKYWDNLFLLFK